MARAANPFASVKAKAPVKDLAKALGDIVKKRLAKPAPKPTWSGVDYARSSGGVQGGSGSTTPRSTPTPRGGRRRGRVQTYSLTGKRNDARFGTWRHYMIDAIMIYDNTAKAERVHETECKNEKWRKNRLDFGWAAKNGYINFN